MRPFDALAVVEVPITVLAKVLIFKFGVKRLELVLASVLVSVLHSLVQEFVDVIPPNFLKIFQLWDHFALFKFVEVVVLNGESGFLAWNVRQ